MDALVNIGVILAAIGAINWGLVGLFNFDLVAAITTGQVRGDQHPLEDHLRGGGHRRHPGALQPLAGQPQQHVR